MSDKFTNSPDEQFYQSIVEDIPILICRFNPDGEIIFANKLYANYFGKKVEDLIGTNFIKLIPEEDRKYVMENISSLSPIEPIQSHEHKVIDADGEIKWHRWTNRALFDENNHLLIYQATGEDITNRKKVEDQIIESEAKYSAFL